MIRIPKLNPQQRTDLKELKANEGFKILTGSIERTIQENNVKLANWDFQFYVDKELDGQEEFRKVQQENAMLKSFMVLLMSTDRIKEEENIDISGNAKDVYQ